MITKKFFLVALFAAAASLAIAQNHEEGVLPTGNGNENIRKVELYPNPAVDFLSVKFETPCARRVKVSMHNIIGNVVEVEIEIVDERELKLNVKDLPLGYY